jgi:hypothetical protein
MFGQAAVLPETSERYHGYGQATRKVRMEDKHRQMHEIEVTLHGWKVLLIDALTKIPLAVKVGKIHEHEALWIWALVTQARMNLAGVARFHKVIFGFCFVDFIVIDHHIKARIVLGRLARIEDAEQVAEQEIGLPRPQAMEQCAGGQFEGSSQVRLLVLP